MGTSASFARKALHCLAAALLTLALVPTSALAQGEAEQPQDAIGSQAGETQEAGSDQVDEGSFSTPAASPAEGGTLASALVGAPTAFINSDVALDSEPIIGSFTVDGLTFAVTGGTDVELVGVSPGWQQVAGSQEGDGSPVAPMLASGPDGSTLSVPESITYDGTDYAVTSIGAYAFYLSGVTDVELPASVGNVDDRAFRSSDVASVSVADDNPTYSSFDGALYSADRSSLLLIPEGKQGTVLLPKRAEVADAGKFSHCSLASAIAVEEGSAAFASENGLLYDASLTTLLRVPAGAIDIVIRDGCTTIAAGAMEACASLATITAPASVATISPDVFTSVPTVSLPAASAVADDPGASTGATVEPSEQAGSIPASGSATTQLTAMVALSSTDDDLPEVDPAAIAVLLHEGALDGLWEGRGFSVEQMDEEGSALMQSAAVSQADAWAQLLVNGGRYCTTQYPGIIYEGDGVGQSLEVGSRVIFSSTTTTGQISFGSVGTYDNPGSTFVCFSTQKTYPGGTTWTSGTRTWAGGYVIWRVPIAWDANGGYWNDDPADMASKQDSWYSNTAATGHGGSQLPKRNGYRFLGWESSSTGAMTSAGDQVPVLKQTTYTAQWELLDCDLGFDVDSEPGDEDYPGEAKDDQAIVKDQIEAGDKVEISDPKRPGYVFQGWVIPNTEGTEAIDQDLVYQNESDGKWYVDASKLPDYANDDGRVELTARWTSVISVDVPSAVTFYADVVTQGNESREGAASSAFGQNKVASQSEVDLRIVGLESTAVATQGSTLGADSILKKSASATPSSSTQKLFSLYPTDKALTADDLQDPDAVSQAKPSDAVDFALDDLLLEKSFSADSFTIPAGDTLNLGYRLNLAETGTELDYDTLATLDEGTSASIANISYTFAGDVPYQINPTGSTSDPLWVELSQEESDALGFRYAAPGVYGLTDIKAAADDLSLNAENPEKSKYYTLYETLLHRQMTDKGNPGEGPYFQMKTEGAYLPVQLLGICQDIKTSGGKAGLTLQVRDVYAFGNVKSVAAGGGAFATSMNPTATNAGAWQSAPLRGRLRTTFLGYLDQALQSAIVPVDKFQQMPSGVTASYLQKTTDETVWLPSMHEVFGASFSLHNEAEGAADVARGYEPFQYQAYQGNDGAETNAKAVKLFNGAVAEYWWLRSAYRNYAYGFTLVHNEGIGTSWSNFATIGVCPAFCL